MFSSLSCLVLKTVVEVQRYKFIHVVPSESHVQVETAIVPSFEAALSESEWLQAQEERRQAEEAAAEGEAKGPLISVQISRSAVSAATAFQQS